MIAKNEQRPLFKKFLALSSEGKEPEAYAIAKSIVDEGYPDSLKKICEEYILKTAHAKPIRAHSKYTTSLYTALSGNIQGGPEAYRWLPFRLLEWQHEQEPSRGKKTNKEVVLQYALEGNDLLNLLNTTAPDKTESAIAPFFDHIHYGEVHADMRGASRGDAIEHYMAHGSREPEREPNYLFRNNEFFELYPWTKRVHINPLILFSHWPQEFEQYAKIAKRRYNIAKEVGSSTIFTFCSYAASAQQSLIGSDYARVLAIAKEQATTPRIVKARGGNSLNIHIVIPDFTPGGGGHMTIFRMVKHLELAGHTCTIWVKGYNHHNHPLGASRSATTHYQSIKSKVLPLNAHYAFATGDAIIATSWDTVEIVLANKNFKDHFYLVQDYEPYFYARGSRSLKAERTYSQNIKTICASTWLHDIMKTKFGRVSVSFDLAYNPDVYYPQKSGVAINKLPLIAINCPDTEASGCQSAPRPVIRIAFYARTRTERRAVELAIEGLGLVEQKKYDLCVELFGEDKGRIKLPDNIVGVDHGILSPNKLAALYRSCDIGLTFSATNYALVPQEMMACGLPVIEIENDSTKAIYPANTLWLAKPSAISIALAIETLAENREIRECFAQNGLDWVRQHSWEKSFKTVEQFIKAEVNNKVALEVKSSSSEYYRAFPHQPIKLSTINDPVVSIVIPTLNGGDMLLDSVRKVLSQEIDRNYEILIIDSMSNDGSIDKLPDDCRLSLYKVNQASFQHGRTRNIAASLARGQYVAFLTQDAIPLNEYWLSNLIQPFILSEEVAAVFGRHVSHAHHPSTARVMLDAHFESFAHLGIHNIVPSLRSYWAENPGFRQAMHFYSDNNSCLRKSFWEDFPYPDVDYGEDQLFADWIAQAEFTKAYVHDAIVMHSHQYTFEEEFKRCKTEAYFFAKYFGYDLSQARPDMELGIRDESVKLLANYRQSLEKGDIDEMLANIRAKYEGYSAGIELFWNWLNQSKRID